MSDESAERRARYGQAARPLVDRLTGGVERNKEVTEHAVMMSGGGMHVRCDDPEIEGIYPLDEWIPHQQRFGGKVYRRRIVVVEDWAEVPPV